MIRIQRWLLYRQKEFHYAILILSVAILLCCITLTAGDKDLSRIILNFLAMILCFAGIIYIRAWYQFNKYTHYGKRICTEYLRVIHKQPYKLDRLSKSEFEVLAYLLNDYSIEEISLRMHCTFEMVYIQIEKLREKLEVRSKEGLLDIDFSKAF